MSCEEFNEKIPLYVYEELASEERAAFESHVAACAACRGALEETRRLLELMKERPVPEPSAELAARSRRALEAAIDKDAAALGWKGLLESWAPVLLALTPQRVGTALALVVMGFGIGWAARPHRGATPPAAGGGTGVSAADVSNLRINNISQVSPGPESGGVRITVDAERRMTLEGSLDDPHIRQVLVDAVKSYDNPGIRRESLDVLRARPDNPAVREALLYTIGNDENAGLRLEALETVRELDWTPEVRNVVLRTIEKDTNPGVRVEAVDALVDHADAAVLPALERLAERDSNPYVRLKSASAIHRLKNAQ